MKMKLNCDSKRKYEKPAMRVFELQHRTMLLQGSVNSTLTKLDVTYAEEDI